jgi:outer membrane protein assembly factor BamB
MISVAETFVSGSRRFPGWRARLRVPRAVATPCLSHGHVIFGAGFGSHEIYALRESDGHLAWRLRTKDDGPTAVTTLDGLGFANTESCTLEAFDVEAGELRWEKWLGDPLLAQPAAADGRVFMAYPRDGQHWLGAFVLRTGEQTWEQAIGHDVITAPICKGVKVYIATYDGAVTCLDAATGEVRWKKALNATSAPWVYRDEVYVSQRKEQRRPRSQTSEREKTAAVGISERTASVYAVDGEMLAAMSAKHAVYLDRNWGVPGVIRGHARWSSTTSFTKRRAIDSRRAASPARSSSGPGLRHAVRRVSAGSRRLPWRRVAFSSAHRTGESSTSTPRVGRCDGTSTLARPVIGSR